jgi:glycosyltransferase involved in cell wall biosynthesis
VDLAPRVLRGPLSALGGSFESGLARGRRLASAARRHAAQGRHHKPGDPVGCLSAGDVLVTLGLDWEAGFTSVLGHLKQQQRFRVIGCCYDVIPIAYPQYCVPGVAQRFREYLGQLVGYCDRIACISDCTRRDLEGVLGRLGLPIPGLFNLPLGTDLPVAGGGPSAEVEAVAARPFFLFVSTLERRKNHEVLHRAMHRLAERHDPAALPRLVLVGSLGWGVGDLMNDIANDPKTQGLIVPLHRVSDSDLRFLYERALFCVYPSLYEGWGLPVAEALSLGKPVICSDRGPAREVAGDLVDYLDPWDLPAWVAAIERFWREPGLLARRAAEVQARYRPPTWADASEVLAAQALALESTGTAPRTTADRG